MFLINAMAMIIMVIGICKFVKHFKMIDNNLEDAEECAYIRREAINRCLAYGNVIAISGAILIAKLVVTLLI